MRAFTGTISNLVSPLALAFAASAYAEVPAPYAVAGNQFVTVTVGITTFSDFFGTDYSEDSMVVPIIGNGNFGLFPNALPFTFAENEGEFHADIWRRQIRVPASVPPVDWMPKSHG